VITLKFPSTCGHAAGPPAATQPPMTSGSSSHIVERTDFQWTFSVSTVLYFLQTYSSNPLHSSWPPHPNLPMSEGSGAIFFFFSCTCRNRSTGPPGLFFSRRVDGLGMRRVSFLKRESFSRLAPLAQTPFLHPPSSRVRFFFKFLRGTVAHRGLPVNSYFFTPLKVTNEEVPFGYKSFASQVLASPLHSLFLTSAVFDAYHPHHPLEAFPIYRL